MLTALDTVDFPGINYQILPCPQDAAGLLFGGNLLAAFQDIQDFQAVMPVGCHIFPAPVIDAENDVAVGIAGNIFMGIGNHGAILSCRRRAAFCHGKDFPCTFASGHAMMERGKKDFKTIY